MPYCPYCGTQLQPQHRFCINCGKPVESGAPAQPYQAPPPAYAPQPGYAPQPAYAPAGERVQNVIPNLKKPKFMGQWDTYSVAVTDRRSIFAQLTGDMANRAIKEAQQASKAKGGGFFDQWADQMDASVNYWKRYLQMNPDEILREQPGNFAVEHRDLREVKVRVHDEKRGAVIFHHTEAEWIYGQGKFKVEADMDISGYFHQAYGGKVT